MTMVQNEIEQLITLGMKAKLEYENQRRESVLRDISILRNSVSKRFIVVILSIGALADFHK